jgi:hypothetical protein
MGLFYYQIWPKILVGKLWVSVIFLQSVLRRTRRGKEWLGLDVGPLRLPFLPHLISAKKNNAHPKIVLVIEHK